MAAEIVHTRILTALLSNVKASALLPRPSFFAVAPGTSAPLEARKLFLHKQLVTWNSRETFPVRKCGTLQHRVLPQLRDRNPAGMTRGIETPLAGHCARDGVLPTGVCSCRSAAYSNHRGPAQPCHTGNCTPRPPTSQTATAIMRPVPRTGRVAHTRWTAEHCPGPLVHACRLALPAHFLEQA